MVSKRKKVSHREIIAIIFDFDDTLTDDTITLFLKSKGYNTVKFWKKVNELVCKGWDPPLAYMKRMLDLTKKGALSGVTNQDLRNFGKDLNFYSGIPKMFRELRNIVRAESEGTIKIEYYVISSGLREIIDGSKIRRFLHDCWGCEFSTDSGGVISFPKCSVSFTEKTRCLFQINKGLVGPTYRGKPEKVNKYMPKKQRRIPFPNMIYLGDGLTDIACMSTLEGQKEKGTAFGVFDPEKLKKPEYKARSWLLLRRKVSLHPTEYEKGGHLRKVIEGALLCICRDIQKKRKKSVR